VVNNMRDAERGMREKESLLRTSFSQIPNPEPRTLTFAHSPDPDDAFMFYGFASGAVRIPGHHVQHHLEDIESLNARALKGEFEITAVSAHAYAYLSDRYWVLSCGASVGRGYGPILIMRQEMKSEKRNLKVAIPGKWTTAALAFDLWLSEHRELHVEKVVMAFDRILPAVEHGDVDAGVIIHECQLTYADHGLKKLWDAGAWWEEKTSLPLPLGLAVVRSDLGMPLAREIDTAFRKSILYAQEHSTEALAYALQYGRGLAPALGKRFVGMYVNDDTLAQGKEVQQGLQQLYNLAHTAGFIPRKPDLMFI
jgi:1,4-dihydroxy-6-naphthoate synthase